MSRFANSSSGHHHDAAASVVSAVSTMASEALAGGGGGGDGERGVSVAGLRRALGDGLNAASPPSALHKFATDKPASTTPSQEAAAAATGSDDARTLLSFVTRTFSSGNDTSMSRRAVELLLPPPPPPHRRVPGNGCDDEDARSYASLRASALKDRHGLLVCGSLGLCLGLVGKRVLRSVLASVLSGLAVVAVLTTAGYGQVRWADLMRDAVAFVRRAPRGGAAEVADTNNPIACEAMGLVRRVQAVVTATPLRRITFCAALGCAVVVF